MNLLEKLAKKMPDWFKYESNRAQQEKRFERGKMLQGIIYNSNIWSYLILNWFVFLLLLWNWECEKWILYYFLTFNSNFKKVIFLQEIMANKINLKDKVFKFVHHLAKFFFISFKALSGINYQNILWVMLFKPVFMLFMNSIQIIHWDFNLLLHYFRDNFNPNRN